MIPRHASIAFGATLLLTSACRPASPPTQAAPVTSKSSPPAAVVSTKAPPTPEFINAELESFNTKSTAERLQKCHALLEQPSFLAPHQLFIIAFFLFHSGEKEEGLFWFYAAQLRGRADVNLYTDDTARQIVSVLSMQVGANIQPFAFTDLARLSTIVDKVVAWEATTPRNYDLTWGVSHGMGAVREALGGEAREEGPLIPMQEWESVRKRTRDTYLSSFREMRDDLLAKRPSKESLKGEYADERSQQFIYACGREDAATVQQFLDSGADPNLRGTSGPTPLEAAYLGLRLANFKLLLERGARVELPRKGVEDAPHGILPTILESLTFAPPERSAEAFPFFEKALEMEPKAARLDPSLIHSAASLDDPRFAQLLLNKGARPDQLRDRSGPLEKMWFSRKTAAVLIDAGARRGVDEIARNLNDEVAREALCGPHNADEVAQAIEDAYRKRVPAGGFEAMLEEEKEKARTRWKESHQDRAVLLAALERAGVKPLYTKKHPSTAPTKPEDCNPQAPEPKSQKPSPESCEIVAGHMHEACRQLKEGEKDRNECEERIRSFEEYCASPGDED